MFRSLIVPLLLVLPVGGVAQTQDTDIRPLAAQLTTEEIKTTFTGVTMDGAYNFGRNGRAQSFYVEQHNPDGTLVYKEDGEVEPGRWFVRKNTICFTYPSQLMAGGCFRVYQVKNCYYFYSTSRQQIGYELGEDYWTARSVKMGEAPACERAIS